MTHTDLRACPFCGAALRIRNSVNAYGQCETEGCWMNARKVIVPLDDPRQVSDWNTRARTPDTAPRKPFCETCSKDVAEVLCPTCVKWWADNPPPAPSTDLIDKADAFFNGVDWRGVYLVNKFGNDLITALRAAEAREARLPERADALFGSCFDWGVQCQKSKSFTIMTPEGSEDARSHIVGLARRALGGEP